MANEKRLISANVLIDELKWLQENVSSASAIEIQEYIDRVNRQPTVDAVPIVHGRWEYHGGDDDMNLYGFCSNCHANWDEDVMEKFNYCPNCGADMRGEGNG